MVSLTACTWYFSEQYFHSGAVDTTSASTCLDHSVGTLGQQSEVVVLILNSTQRNEGLNNRDYEVTNTCFLEANIMV